ncbi:MAG: endonuclease III, partial [Clostridia bacterium]|nr:endonuclease III [Clostridia bacterium]
CHRLVKFGRDVCSARSPKCNECPLNSFCPSKE